MIDIFQINIFQNLERSLFKNISKGPSLCEFINFFCAMVIGFESAKLKNRPWTRVTPCIQGRGILTVGFQNDAILE